MPDELNQDTLDAQINSWLDQLGKLKPTQREELADHLRNELRQLPADAALSSEERILVAGNRLGPQPALRQEMSIQQSLRRPSHVLMWVAIVGIGMLMTDGVLKVITQITQAVDAPPVHLSVAIGLPISVVITYLIWRYVLTQAIRRWRPGSILLKPVV